MDHTYQYTVAGKPLTHCPGCNNDLTEPDGIEIELSMDGVNLTAMSNLSKDGILWDTADDAVNEGFHSATLCGKCHKTLIDFDSVEEENIAA
jgi:hypothetical protein